MAASLDPNLIGRLDRLISELLLVTAEVSELDDADVQTLKHHGEDMKAAADLVNNRAHNELYKRQEARRRK